MSVTVQQILIALISGGVVLLLEWLRRPKQKKEIQAIISDQWYKLTERLAEERDDLLIRINRNEQWIKELTEQDDKKQKLIHQIEKDNEECKYQHGVTELEMLQLKKHNDFKVWKRDFVYVIDDDEDVLEEFKHKLAKISVLDYKGFHNYSEFMKEVHINKPPIVVLDYKLGAKTAEDVLKEIGYSPEVFIMSGEIMFEKRFNSKKIKFFLKDDHYIYKIAMAILKYLTDKN